MYDNRDGNRLTENVASRSYNVQYTLLLEISRQMNCISKTHGRNSGLQDEESLLRNPQPVIAAEFCRGLADDAIPSVKAQDSNFVSTHTVQTRILEINWTCMHTHLDPLVSNIPV